MNWCRYCIYEDCDEPCNTCDVCDMSAVPEEEREFYESHFVPRENAGL